MLNNQFLVHISNHLNSNIKSYHSISGGNISSVYILKTLQNKFILKLNNNQKAKKMFLAEEKALNLISHTNTICTPKVIACNSYKNQSYLIMEYIESKSSNSINLKLFGKQLSQLHKVSSDFFGFEEDNFIGNLHQNNKIYKNWNNFYVEERLVPQLQLARIKGLLDENEIPKKEVIKNVCSPYFLNIKPSLLHGDLWQGNYLTSVTGKPYVIDPALYYGHSEVDIAMSKLFGGFDASFYDSYYSFIPKDRLTEDRIKIYQLYYLLVHLNLFGTSYYLPVKQILNHYFLL